MLQMALFHFLWMSNIPLNIFTNNPYVCVCVCIYIYIYIYASNPYVTCYYNPYASYPYVYIYIHTQTTQVAIMNIYVCVCIC